MRLLRFDRLRRVRDRAVTIDPARREFRLDMMALAREIAERALRGLARRPRP